MDDGGKSQQLRLPVSHNHRRSHLGTSHQHHQKKAPLPPQTEENLQAEGKSTEAPMRASWPAASPPGTAASQNHARPEPGDLCVQHCRKRASWTIADPNHPSNSLLPLPSSGRRYWGMGAKLGNSFIPQAIWLLNSLTNNLTARSAHHNLQILNPVHFWTCYYCYSCYIWKGAWDQRISLLQ